MPANRPRTGNKTSFKPGKSGNPSGRPKQTAEQKDALDLIRTLAPKAAEELERLLNDPGCPVNMKIRAIEIVLERTYGKPDAHIEITRPDFAALQDAFAALAALAAEDEQ